jgi:MerR family transcriptional regulator, thiopeptide resistance regulator
VIENAYGSEAQQRWPDNFAQSEARLGKLSATERGQLIEDGNQISRELAEQLKAKVAADAPEVQELINRHYRWVCNFWTPERDSYIALGQMYLDDERFTAHYDEFAPGLAFFIRDAILRYASSNLA